MYVYREIIPQIWTVGHYDPRGEFVPESDHNTTEDAASRVHYLNGGEVPFDEPKRIYPGPLKKISGRKMRGGAAC